MVISTRNSASIFTRIGWATRIYVIKALVRILVLMRRIKPPPPAQRPTYHKYYRARPNLVNYVWIPESYKPGSSPLLPLLIDIHGGGFCIGHPTIDDLDNSIFCHKHGICVVSINYRKAPGVTFPTPVEDVAALIEAVLDDPDLPVDKSKVAVLGYSAGGNLALTAPQINGLHKRIKAVVAFYPVTDLSRSLETRLETAIPPVGREDFLIAESPSINWAYLRQYHDRRNPLLSPIFASRDVLPQKLYILGCEYDMLCGEARDMATKCAESASDRAALTKRELEDGRKGWQSGSVTWEELEGLEHGFNQRYAHERNKEIREKWQRRTEVVHARVAQWLFKEVYAD